MALDLLRKIHSPSDLKKLSVDQLPELAKEVRHAICDQVSKSGGHLAPNLGVVELTIALHYVFDFGHDRLLFDVGHQCYPHKLLTGRLDLMNKLRQKGGMAGFPEPSESSYDLFSVGHAGTAISTAVGMARADTVLGQGDRSVVSIIGDASIVNGVAMEGLNNAGTLKRQFLVVLNDNGMSIAKPQGAMASYFDRVRVSPTYTNLKNRAHEVLKRIPGGSLLEDMYHRAGEMMKAAFLTGHMFEQFGFVCVGPVDGHDLPSLVDMLNEVKQYDAPVLLHAKTVKGKGFDFSEGDATTFHSPRPFVVEGCRVELKKAGRSFTAAYADAMIDVMKRDEKVFAVTAAMPDGTGISKVQPLFPERTLDTGICESHAMDMCAGMAKVGLRPFFAVYSTFSHRALDQVFQEVSLQGLPVRVCMDRAGYVGGDGAVHHGFMDISIFRPLPNVALLAVSDEENLRAGLEFMRTYDAGASLVRYPRDNVATEPLIAADKLPPYELGKGIFIKRTGGRVDPVAAGAGAAASAALPKPDLCIVAYGTEVYLAAQAMADLEQQGYDIALYDARFAKPVDIDLFEKLVALGSPVLTVEDHTITGGFGAAVLEGLNDRRISTDLIHRAAMPERWFHQDSRTNQLADAGLDAAGIARRIRAILDERNGGVQASPRIHVDVNSAKVR
ncbi:MAG: 1-deoxy-D-xylulose-5-phosphate synthase [Phycisphaeraceae bacterium]